MSCPVLEADVELQFIWLSLALDHVLDVKYQKRINVNELLPKQCFKFWHIKFLVELKQKLSSSGHRVNFDLNGVLRIIDSFTQRRVEFEISQFVESISIWWKSFTEHQARSNLLSRHFFLVHYDWRGSYFHSFGWRLLEVELYNKDVLCIGVLMS